MVHKRALLLIEEDEVLVIEEEEGIEAEGAKRVIGQEQEVMELEEVTEE